MHRLSDSENVYTCQKDTSALTSLPSTPHKRAPHHVPHLSTDSATTADDDDLTDYHSHSHSHNHNHRFSHRRANSGSESIYSELTESTEQHDKGLSSPGPSISKLQSPLTTNSPSRTDGDAVEYLQDPASDDMLPQSTYLTTFDSPFDFDGEQLDDPSCILERISSDEERRQKLSKMFSRAASNGDMDRIADMLDHFREWIDIEAQDEDGTSPLIYAACFGHVEIAFMLLEAGAVVDARDKW
ncbi:hypothetical protein BGZ94_006319 [Podila epigama]|nr:hypothetical protein BGZ94_006319 [Podila epigama]